MPLSPSDLFLSPDLSETDAQQYLESLGFRDPVAADQNLRAMAEDLTVREALGAASDLLLPALVRTPSPDAALVGLSRYLSARTAKATFVNYLRDDPLALQILADVLGTSPFLSEILIRNPEYFHWLISQIDRATPETFAEGPEIATVAADLDGRAALNALKRLRRRAILRIATRDLLGHETFRPTTAQLSDLASLLIERVLHIVTTELLAREHHDRQPGRFAVVGMGKLGGRELNYSSDVDLVYVYDPGDPSDSGANEFFLRLARALTTALGEHTEESYFYRVDLRLRPMGRRGAVAYTLEQYEQYYDTWGETFERFALIKARPIAGDPGLGRRFLDLVQPFVYRRYLDHAALEEIYRYKARIDRALDPGRDARDVKLGRGGIREIELFTQVLQLTYGGNQPELRQPNTLDALAALCSANLLSGSTRDELTRAYAFLRTVEHRLQIVHDHQTHSLSSELRELEVTARRLGFQTAADLETDLRNHRDRVHAVYRSLFDRRRETSQFGARQFFRILIEEVSDEEAALHLRAYGLREPAAALEMIRTLAQRASSAHVPSTARNVLANLLAVSMARIARCARPEQVLNRLEQLSACTGTQSLYRSLLDHEGLRDVLIDVLDSGDLLSHRLIRYPEMLDSLLLQPPDVESARRSYVASLHGMERLDRPDRLNQLRRFKAIEEFKILLEWLAGGALGTLHEKLSWLAACCVERVAEWHAPAGHQGGADERPWAIVALGKLGGQELTVHSDLDLAFLYEGDPEDSTTFMRYQSFVQALQAFLETPTDEGVAYRIDTRLRPEGGVGALATPLVAFHHYLRTRAEGWERLAWTRCRVLAGSPRLTQQIDTAVTEFVYGPWAADLPRYTHEIRMRMERELAHEDETTLDFKVGRGGLADIDFLLQLIQIREGHSSPEFRVPGTRRLLARLPPNSYLRPDEAEALRDAHGFLRKIEMFARMESDSSVNWMTPPVLDPIGTRLGFGDPPGEKLLRMYRETTERVRSIYLSVLTRLDGGRAPSDGPRDG